MDLGFVELEVVEFVTATGWEQADLAWAKDLELGVPAAAKDCRKREMAMRLDTLWQEERRSARRHWWRQLLARPAAAPWDELVDEMVHQRFRPAPQCAASDLRDRTAA